MIKLILINGYGRSGSTILEKFVANKKEVVCVGELRNIWERAAKGYKCSCGSSIIRCEYWRPKLIEALSSSEDRLVYDINCTAENFKKVDRVRNFSSFKKVRLYKSCLKIQERLYKSLSNDGQLTILDSSKNPSYSKFLSGSGMLSIINFQLVRNPYAVVHSWKRRKIRKEAFDQEYMPIHPSYKSSLLWLVMNIQAGKLDGSKLIKYEEFVQNPKKVVDNISGIAGLQDLPAGGPVINHTVGGNPIKFSSGSIDIKPDDEWVRSLRLTDKLVTKLVCGFHMKHYDYE